jgi:4-fold beta flower protein
MMQRSYNIPMLTGTKLVPIFKSRGEVGAFLLYPYVYNTEGEWIGWVSVDRSVYSVHGHFVGTLSKEPRILRNREAVVSRRRLQPPSPPPPIRVPSHIPLAPQLPEVMINMIDVLEESPELLPSIDFGDLRDDME